MWCLMDRHIFFLIFLVFNIVRLGQLKSLLLEVLPFWKKLSHYLHAVVSIAAVSSTHF